MFLYEMGNRHCLIIVVLCVLHVHAQFTPGCSFYNGQCVYNVQMGQENQCDLGVKSHQVSSSSAATSPLDTTGGGCSCNDVTSLQGEIQSLRGIIAELQTTFNGLSTQMNITQGNLQSTKTDLTAEQQVALNLLQTLTTKDKMLNETKEELANVLTAAKIDLDKLRHQLIDASRNLSNCQGIPYKPPASISHDYTVFYCGFENAKGQMCTFNTTTDRNYNDARWVVATGQVHSSTGPKEDHTLGTPSGHYMAIDAYSLAEHSSSSSMHSIRLTSAILEPAHRYCVRFWYNMHGSDVQPILVYTRVNGGLGTPILTLPAHSSTEWKMAEVEIDDEHTRNRFQVVIEGATDAHYSYSYHSNGGSYYHSTKNYVRRYGNVAVDDIFIANTTCQDIPVCPPSSYKRLNSDNTTSCYIFHTTPATWYQAATICQQESYRGHLVAVTSSEEQQYLVNTIQSDISLIIAGQTGFYINANDQRSEGSFQWTDTGLPYSLTYTAWHSGQPNNVGSAQDCVLMEYPDDNYTWGDINCNEKHAFICEVEY